MKTKILGVLVFAMALEAVAQTGSGGQGTLSSAAASAVADDGFTHPTQRGTSIFVTPSVETSNNMRQEPAPGTQTTAWWVKKYQFYYDPVFKTVFKTQSLDLLRSTSFSPTDDVTLDFQIENTYPNLGKEILKRRFPEIPEDKLSDTGASLRPLQYYRIYIAAGISWLSGVEIAESTALSGGIIPEQFTMIVPKSKWAEFRKNVVENKMGIPVNLECRYVVAEIKERSLSITGTAVSQMIEKRNAVTGGSEYVTERDVRNIVMTLSSSQVLVDFSDPGMEEEINSVAQNLFYDAAARMPRQMDLTKSQFETLIKSVFTEAASLELGRPILVMWDVAKAASESSSREEANSKIKTILSSNNVSADAALKGIGKVLDVSGSGGISSSTSEVFKDERSFKEFKDKVEFKTGTEPVITFRGLKLARAVDVVQAASSRTSVVKLKASYRLKPLIRSDSLSITTNQLGMIDWLTPPGPIEFRQEKDQFDKISSANALLNAGLQNISGRVEVTNPVTVVNTKQLQQNYEHIFETYLGGTNGTPTEKFKRDLILKGNAGYFLAWADASDSSRVEAVFSRPK